MMKKMFILFFLILGAFMVLERNVYCTEKVTYKKMVADEKLIIPKELEDDKRSLSAMLYDMNRRFYNMMNSLQLLTILVLVLEIFIIALLIKIRKENKQR